MTSTAAITFSQTGVQPPVYIVTSLSNPPWETLEMDVAEEPTASANFIFTKNFKGAAEGSYQYKIRLGADWWIVDESQETTTDDHGNRNNVIHVKPQPVIFAPIATREEDMTDAAHHETSTSSLGKRKDSSMDTTQLAEVPLVVVEKTDDKLSLGDDFGKHATVAQKVAHDMRAADASPDKVIISPESNTESDTEDKQDAPLFRHETLQMNDHPSISFADTGDEVSIQSSTDNTSSSEIISTPSEHDSQNDDELHQGSLLAHETGPSVRKGELDTGLLLSHETGLGHKHADELHDGPLLSHESNPNDEDDATSDEEDEFDRAPLLPHETGFSDYLSSERSAKGDSHVEEVEPQHYGPYDDDASEEDELKNGHLDGAPLLPHERDSALGSNNGSEISSEDVHYMTHGRPTFRFETEAAGGLFGGNAASRIFRTGPHSSSLPHNLPRSDAEDENLHDLSLERFPTGRKQILERVKTIGLHLPEDQPTEDHLHSPQLSVLSQACSSVDLVPTRSYTSLASVPEADNSDDEDDGDEEDGLPSPLMLGSIRPPPGLGHDTQTTTALESSTLDELKDANAQASNNRSAESNEAESISKIDGAHDDSSLPPSSLPETTATPKNILDPISPPPPFTVPSDDNPKTKNTDLVPGLESESHLRQHRQPAEDATKMPLDTPTLTQEDSSSSAKPTTSDSNLAQQLKSQPQSQPEPLINTLINTIFGPLGRWLSTCLGDRRRASISVLVLSVVVMAWYTLSIGKGVSEEWS